MEQEYGEPNSATSLAARTVLPGEPFEGPAASAVPGPRDQPLVAAPAYQEEPVWNFAPPAENDFAALPPARSFEPATYDPTYGAVVDPHHAPAELFTPTYATADSLTTPEQYEDLHQFGALPVAEGYDQSAAAPAYDSSPPPAYPAPAGYDLAPPAFPAPAYPSPAGDLPVYPAAPSWPTPEASQHAFNAPAPELLTPIAPSAEGVSIGDEPPTGEDADGAHRKSRGPNKALIALAAVVILGGGGYFGYTHFVKSSTDSSTSTGTSTPKAATPVAPKSAKSSTPTVTTPTGTVSYNYPSSLAGFSVRTSSAASALQRQITSFAKGAYPAYLGTPVIASYGTASTASVVAYTFHPAASKLSDGFATLLAGAHQAATGNTVGDFTSVPAGAAGGSMTCGSQTGASPISYCIWKGTSAVGMVYMKGQTDTPINQALTRELRAYAEH